MVGSSLALGRTVYVDGHFLICATQLMSLLLKDGFRLISLAKRSAQTQCQDRDHRGYVAHFASPRIARHRRQTVSGDKVASATSPFYLTVYYHPLKRL